MCEGVQGSYFYSSGSQPGAILALEAHLAMSGDIWLSRLEGGDILLASSG